MDFVPFLPAASAAKAKFIKPDLALHTGFTRNPQTKSSFSVPVPFHYHLKPYKASQRSKSKQTKVSEKPVQRKNLILDAANTSKNLEFVIKTDQKKEQFSPLGAASELGKKRQVGSSLGTKRVKTRRPKPDIFSAAAAKRSRKH